MHLSSAEKEPGQISHVVLEGESPTASLPGTLDISATYFDVSFIQDGPDKVKIERREHPHIADLHGIFSELDRSFAACQITKA